MPGHRVETVIGRGASSTVWQGRDAMGDAVAIKVPHEVGWLADEQAARTEQHVLMAVRHEHLVGLRDVVAMPDDRTALVFDLVTGASLRGMVRSRGHLRPGEVVTVVTPLCEAVAALHSAGGLHGDISPSNVMVTAEGKPLLLDLGAARLAGSPADTPVFGTPGFVAPEVRQGLPPTEASDVFSLGAVAWFCLTGNGAPDTMLRLDPEVVRSHVGAEVAEVVGACIDPDPQRRPASAALARLFFEAAPAEPVEVVVDADEASALTHRIRAEARDEDPVTEAGHEHDSRGRWWTRWRWTVRGRPIRAAAVVAGLAALLAVAVGVGAVASRSAAVAPDDALTTGAPPVGTAFGGHRCAPERRDPVSTPSGTRRARGRPPLRRRRRTPMCARAARRPPLRRLRRTPTCCWVAWMRPGRRPERCSRLSAIDEPRPSPRGTRLGSRGSTSRRRPRGPPMPPSSAGCARRARGGRD